MKRVKRFFIKSKCAYNEIVKKKTHSYRVLSICTAFVSCHMAVVLFVRRFDSEHVCPINQIASSQ